MSLPTPTHFHVLAIMSLAREAVLTQDNPIKRRFQLGLDATYVGRGRDNQSRSFFIYTVRQQTYHRFSLSKGDQVVHAKENPGTFSLLEWKLVWRHRD